MSENPTHLPGQITRLLEDLAKAPEPPPESAPASRVGDRIGRFLLVRELGRGGFGVVFEAEDTELRRRVAIKVLRPERGGTPSTLEWIRREGEAAAKVHHPTIVTLHDVGQWEGGTYLVYELLEGETLTERLERGPLTRAEARRVLRSVAVGLSQMHAAGVVHRDLKPDNVFIESDGTVKTLDLGLAQVAGAVGIRAGSPPYAAPEQWDGDAADARADVYAWGILARKLLAQKGDGPLASDPAAPPGAFRALVERARAQDPALRPTDGAALVAELDGIERRKRRAGLLALGTGALALLALFLAIGRMLTPAPPAPSGPYRVAIADAENVTGNPSLDGVGDLVARGLQASPRLQILDRARLVGVLRASGRPAPDRLDRGIARFATRQAGGAALLVPTVAEDGAELSIEIEALEPESGNTLFLVRERASSTQGVLQAVERLVVLVRKSLKDREPEVRAADQEISRAVSSSLQAHQHYLAGVRCVDRPSDGGGTSFSHCRKHFRQALAIDPEFPLAHFELAKIAYWDGYPTEDLREILAPALRNVDRLPPREQALVRAWDAGLSSHPNQAIEILLEAGREFPEDPRLAQALGEALRKKGRHAEAVPHLERAVTLDPGYEIAADMLIDSLATLDDQGRLAQVADRLAALPPSPGILIAEAAARASTGDLERALEIARRAAPGGEGLARDYLEEILILNQRWAEVEAMLRVDATRDPDRISSRLVRYLLLRGRVREARSILARREVPTDPRLRAIAQAHEVGQFLVAQKDAAGIRRIADETAAWSEESAASLAPALAYVGEVERAQALAQALVEEPGSQALVAALVAWRQQGAAAALPALRRVSRADPVSPTVGPPEAPSWFAAECAVEASPDDTALEDLHRFQRYPRPMGQVRIWAYPRSLLLEARVLAHLGRTTGARAHLAKLEDLLAKADPDYPLLADMRVLRRGIGAPRNPVAAAPDPGRR
jgi:eukaryotic-like serine/threonine-protein kinase